MYRLNTSIFTSMVVVMSTRILILNGQPDHSRLCSALTDRYQQGAAQAQVTRFDLADMSFDANLQQGYQQVQPLEPDLQAFQQADRKSTRLNSSHVKISYAVFCLKKKKTCP